MGKEDTINENSAYVMSICTNSLIDSPQLPLPPQAQSTKQLGLAYGKFFERVHQREEGAKQRAFVLELWQRHPLAHLHNMYNT